MQSTSAARQPHTGCDRVSRTDHLVIRKPQLLIEETREVARVGIRGESGGLERKGRLVKMGAIAPPESRVLHSSCQTGKAVGGPRRRFAVEVRVRNGDNACQPGRNRSAEGGNQPRAACISRIRDLPETTRARLCGFPCGSVKFRQVWSKGFE